MIPKRETAASKLSSGKVERHRLGLDEVEVVEAGVGGALAAVGEHVGGDVGGDAAAVRPGDLRRGQSGLTVAGGDVEHPAAGLDPGELDQAIGDRPHRTVDPVRPLLPAGRGAVPALLLCAPELDRVDRLAFHSTPLSLALAGEPMRCGRLRKVPRG